MGAHTEVLCHCPAADSSSTSSDEDETASVTTTAADSSETPATASAPTDDCCEVCLLANVKGSLADMPVFASLVQLCRLSNLPLADTNGDTRVLLTLHCDYSGTA